ncbi:hypothetical protein R3P38DRAFT_3271993 [Favolaschia claudopus]|uniref:F-box domain-containing protein n=1 Tax=Favolaschia claudopus TaxID=2862362 RepID=A0AAW0B464_9AGAR
MVITRRAFKISRSIIAWLPNEVLFFIIAYAAHPELLSLCLTSRLMREISTRFLYRGVHLNTKKTLKLFLRVDRWCTSPPALSHVQKFLVKQDLKLAEAHVTQITRVVLLMTSLKHLLLYLAEPIEFHQLLQDGVFPNLVTFRYIVQPNTASAFIGFLHRHPTINNLTFASEESIQFPRRADSTYLKIYEGPNWGLSLFDVSGLTSVSLMWYSDGVDIDCCLSQLTEAKDLECIVILTSTTTPTEAEILAGISRHAPHVKVLRLRSLVAKQVGLSLEQAVEIQGHLHKFSALSTIELPAVDYNTEFRLDHDMQALKLWQDACKTISSATLNSIIWQSVNGEWYCANSGIKRLITMMKEGVLGPTFVLVPAFEF